MRPTANPGPAVLAAGAEAVLKREPNRCARTFPSEIVTCRMADGSEQRLFCKYSDGQDNGDFGHRGGVAYEAEVYRQVLQPLQTSTPRFYCCQKSSTTGKSWWVLACIYGGR